MQAYGLRKGTFLEDFGPPTREAKLKSANRAGWRRCLHKKGRNDAKKVIQEQVNTNRDDYVDEEDDGY